MLSDEPDMPLHARNEVKTEEGKFEQAENFDKNFLTKRYPSLALPNQKNKEEIDILDDLEFDNNKEEEKKLDTTGKDSKRKRSRSRSNDSRDRKRHHRSRSDSRDAKQRHSSRRHRDDRRSNSRDRDHDRHRRRSRSDERHRRHHRSRSRSHEDSRRRRESPKRQMPFKLGDIYKGRVMKVQDFGFFVLIEDEKSRYKKEGLVHVSQIR
jgi:ATP-dependent RNA helicase DHX8/PRP22